MPKGRKLRYSIDDFNRILVNKGNRRYCLEGEFKIQRNNLIFEPHRKSPLAKELSLPEIITFRGNWYLTENYDLGYSLLENRHRKEADELQLKGRIIS